MKYIIEFEKWVNINEKKAKFDATIKTDNDRNNDGKNEITLEVSDGDEIITYTVDDDKNVQSIYKESENTNTNNINDADVEKYVLKTAYNIGKLQDITRGKEIDRLTGGDDTDITHEIIKIIDKGDIRENTLCLYDDILSKNNNFLINGTKYIKLNFNDKRIKNKSKYKFDIKDIYNKGEGNIGKGEYLLPLLFNDVYKEPVFTKGAKGDNYILNGENKYYLELKAPGSSPYQNFKNSDIKDIEELKNEIIDVFVRYTKNQRNNDRKKLYLCFFYEKDFDKNNIKKSNKNIKEKIPAGMLFINASEGVDLKNVLKDMIIIDKDIYLPPSDKDFKFAYDGKNILCVVNTKYKDILKTILTEE